MLLVLGGWCEAGRVEKAGMWEITLAQAPRCPEEITPYLITFYTSAMILSFARSFMAAFSSSENPVDVLVMLLHCVIKIYCLFELVHRKMLQYKVQNT